MAKPTDETAWDAQPTPWDPKPGSRTPNPFLRQPKAPASRNPYPGRHVDHLANLAPISILAFSFFTYLLLDTIKGWNIYNHFIVVVLITTEITMLLFIVVAVVHNFGHLKDPAVRKFYSDNFSLDKYIVNSLDRITKHVKPFWDIHTLAILLFFVFSMLLALPMLVLYYAHYPVGDGGDLVRVGLPFLAFPWLTAVFLYAKTNMSAYKNFLKLFLTWLVAFLLLYQLALPFFVRSSEEWQNGILMSIVFLLIPLIIGAVPSYLYLKFVPPRAEQEAEDFWAFLKKM